jgi:predicted Zn-ribbon and HTH transcriptional regulator
MDAIMDEAKLDATRTGRVIEERKCQLCGWEWFPKAPGAEPGLCPHCKSVHWRIGRRRRAARHHKDKEHVA